MKSETYKAIMTERRLRALSTPILEKCIADAEIVGAFEIQQLLEHELQWRTNEEADKRLKDRLKPLGVPFDD